MEEKERSTQTYSVPVTQPFTVIPLFDLLCQRCPLHESDGFLPLPPQLVQRDLVRAEVGLGPHQEDGGRRVVTDLGVPLVADVLWKAIVF